MHKNNKVLWYIAKRLERWNTYFRFWPEAPCSAFLELSEFLQLLENAVVASSTLNGNNNKITEAYYSIISFTMLYIGLAVNHKPYQIRHIMIIWTFKH